MKLTADMSFDALIDLACDDPSVVAEIERRFRSIVAVLVVDFSSMRRRMGIFGTVYALVDIRLAMKTYLPAVESMQGRVIKSVADTVFAVFETPSLALAATLEGHGRMADFNASRNGDIDAGTPNAPIFPKAGLGYGPNLVTSDGNLYGPEATRAFVLGEDVAQNCEILASSAFASALGTPPPGVGVHGAPQDREQDAGFPFQIYTDFRFEPE